MRAFTQRRLGLLLMGLVSLLLPVVFKPGLTKVAAAPMAQTTARGSFAYYPRNGVVRLPARFTKVYLYDADVGGTDDLLAETVTDGSGAFAFPARDNMDDDDGGGPLDLYVVWELDAEDSPAARRRVTRIASGAYRWRSTIHENVPSGETVIDAWVPDGSDEEPAMWIFQDLRRAWEFVTGDSDTEPGSVIAKWEKDVNSYLGADSSFFFGQVMGVGPFIFIADQSSVSSDIVIHEAGHHYIYNLTGWWTPLDTGCWRHSFWTVESQSCAWSEGFADFLPLAVNDPSGMHIDVCFDFDPGPCGVVPPGRFINLESPMPGDGNPNGDTVEGRVAGALYDLFDETNPDTKIDNLDNADFDFVAIANIVGQTSPKTTFSEFWQGWQASGQNQHHTVRALHQKTIEYNTLPRFDPPLPDRNALPGVAWPGAIDLWEYTIDGESMDGELTWQIAGVSDEGCGVTINEHFIDISPEAGWTGSCSVTVEVSDSLATAQDTFEIRVTELKGKVYLPRVHQLW